MFDNVKEGLTSHAAFWLLGLHRVLAVVLFLAFEIILCLVCELVPPEKSVPQAAYQAPFFVAFLCMVALLFEWKTTSAFSWWLTLCLFSPCCCCCKKRLAKPLEDCSRRLRIGEDMPKPARPCQQWIYMVWLTVGAGCYIFTLGHFVKYQKLMGSEYFQGPVDDLGKAVWRKPRPKRFYFNDGFVDLARQVHYVSGYPALAPVYASAGVAHKMESTIVFWSVPADECSVVPCEPIRADVCREGLGSGGLCGYRHEWKCFSQNERAVVMWGARHAGISAEVLARSYNRTTCLPTLVLVDPEKRRGPTPNALWAGVGILGAYVGFELCTAFLCVLVTGRCCLRRSRRVAPGTDEADDLT